MTKHHKKNMKLHRHVMHEQDHLRRHVVVGTRECMTRTTVVTHSQVPARHMHVRLASLEAVQATRRLVSRDKLLCRVDLPDDHPLFTVRSTVCRHNPEPAHEQSVSLTERGISLLLDDSKYLEEARLAVWFLCLCFHRYTRPNRWRFRSSPRLSHLLLRLRSLTRFLISRLVQCRSTGMFLLTHETI